MRRIHTTFDLLEAHIITEMLRQHGLRAWLFDADFVRQNWLQSIAFGGYRIMVPDDAVTEAREVMQEYKNGTLALSDEHRPACPICGKQHGIDDPWPRRHIFLALILLPWLTAIALLVWKPSVMQLTAALAIQSGLYLLLPWFAIAYFKRCWQCTACGHRWREPPAYSFAELAKMAESGDQVTTD